MNEQRVALEVDNIAKTYAAVRAVDNISFEVQKGEIFGLLGPNGAGKTTTIRMVLDIIRPDHGKISILGGPMNEAKKDRIGYLPEERGLYDDMSLIDILLFLGQLKGISRPEARRRAENYLREVDLWEAHDRKISALSRGMNQKAQFIAATLHNPELLIIDEPFSGLDPVNTRMIKKLIFRLRDQGTAIIMSTHQMYQVEEMCERILLIDRGRQVLHGPLMEIRKQFAPNAIEVQVEGELPEIGGVERATISNGRHRLLLKEGNTPAMVLKDLVSHPQIIVHHFEQVQISLEEIFVKVVGHEVQWEEAAR
jgi:ABC-2 type transport system ATP-binding protein